MIYVDMKQCPRDSVRLKKKKIQSVKYYVEDKPICVKGVRTCLNMYLC